MMKVQDVMTRTVVTVKPETPIREVAALLVEHAIGGVPVVDEDGRVLGVVSEADLLVKEQGRSAIRRRPLAWLLGESADTRQKVAKLQATNAAAAMTSPPITIAPHRSVATAAQTMVARRVNRLPVVEDGRLVGIVTRADLVRAFVRSDEELVETIRTDVILKMLWLDPERFEVTVTNGVARITGTAERKSTVEMLERVVAMVPGVVGVLVDVGYEMDDGRIEAPGPDFVSAYTVPRER